MTMTKINIKSPIIGYIGNIAVHKGKSYMILVDMNCPNLFKIIK